MGCRNFFDSCFKLLYAPFPTNLLFKTIYILPKMDVDASSSSQASQRQVRLHLTTRDGDIALPESTGPILVPTGKFLNIWFRNSEERFLSFLFCFII